VIRKSWYQFFRKDQAQTINQGANAIRCQIIAPKGNFGEAAAAGRAGSSLLIEWAKRS
jgi:hypothetical protein